MHNKFKAGVLHFRLHARKENEQCFVVNAPPISYVILKSLEDIVCFVLCDPSSLFGHTALHPCLAVPRGNRQVRHCLLFIRFLHIYKYCFRFAHSAEPAGRSEATGGSL